MSPSARPLAPFAFTLGIGLSSTPALADAVPPPPEHCPKGHVGITDHGGPKCVKEAPKNCPPGYRGELRGRCVLATCTADDQCKDGRRCLQIATCQEYREHHWTGWGWQARQRPLRDNFLGGPPRPQPPGPPKKAWVNLHICGQDGPCNAPGECRAAGLCYPPDQIGKTQAKLMDGSAASVEGENTAKPETEGVIPVTADGGDAPESSEDTPKTVATSDATTTTGTGAPATDGGGCRKGCAVTPSRSWWGALSLPLLAGLALLRRRARRS